MKYTTILLALAVDQAQAFWGTGHLIVSRIAHDLLASQNPRSLAAAESLLSVYKTNKSEGSHAFVECATYADDVKAHGGAFQSNWHFIDTPFLDEGGKISDFPFVFDQHHIVEAMTGIKQMLTRASGYQNTYTYQQISSNLSKIQGHSPSEDEIMSFSLRLLIHYSGDIGQPLHDTSRVDHEYPSGDRGGNSFPLPTQDTVSNLHSLYDSVFYEFGGYPSLPMNDSLWNQFGSYSSNLLSKYPKSSLPNPDNLDIKSWSDQAFGISQSFVYNEINHKEGQALPADYVSQGRSIVEKQLVLSGYRLKNLIVSLFPGEPEDIECEDQIEDESADAIQTNDDSDSELFLQA